MLSVLGVVFLAYPAWVQTLPPEPWTEIRKSMEKEEYKKADGLVMDLQRECELGIFAAQDGPQTDPYVEHAQSVALCISDIHFKQASLYFEFARIADPAIPKEKEGLGKKLIVTLEKMEEFFKSIVFLGGGGKDSFVREQSEWLYREFLKLYPTDPRAAEAQYKLGLLAYARIIGHDRDISRVKQAQKELSQVKQDYPESPFAAIAQTILLFETRRLLALHEIDVGNTYLKTVKNYQAAISRFETVAKEYGEFPELVKQASDLLQEARQKLNEKQKTQKNKFSLSNIGINTP